MKTCINTSTISFYLYDEFVTDEDLYTIVSVEVKHLQYGNQKGEEFYDISYTYSYSFGNEKRKLGHPFAKDDAFEEHETGDIIAVNELSSVLVKFLLMSMDELNERCGRVTPNAYKISVMHAITRFWD